MEHASDSPRNGALVYWIAGIVVAALALLYISRVGILFLGATEGDVPAASSIGLPTGSEVVAESVDCASGGCWRTLSVRPPDEMAADELAAELGATPGARIRGTFWDPRTISVSARAEGPLLVIRADYWSSEAAP